MLKNYFYITSNLFFYLECDNIIIFSNLGIIKIKNNSLIDFFIIKYSLYSYWFNNSISFFFRHLFLLTSYGYTNTFKIVGVGYRQFYSNNIVIYKLRYSHLIYKVLPLDILTFKKKKKKTYFTLFSLNKNKLNNILHIWLSYRIANVYTKKGFFKKNHTINFKEIIKKLL